MARRVSQIFKKQTADQLVEAHEELRAYNDYRRIIYFIAADGCKMVKIGVTLNDPVLRLKALQTGSPHPLTLLGYAREQELGCTELDLHTRFSHLRSHGEWFHLEPELQEYINSAIPFEPAPTRYISISEYKARQKEGIARAKERGVYKGRQRVLSPERANELYMRVKRGESKAALAREFKITRETVYQYARNLAEREHCQSNSS